MQEASLEARLWDLGVKDADFAYMLKDYRHLSAKDREAILKPYRRIKRTEDGSGH